jgi:signal transduction histidine kinase
MTSGILVVDDVPRSSELARQLLEPAGYQVRCASAEASALLACETEVFSLILLAVPFAGSDGTELCRRLRQHASTSETAIMLVSAQPAACAPAAARAAGADDCLTAPLQRSELLARVRALVSAPRSERLRVERDELARIQRRREENIALLVHDMKNPLSGVLSNAEYLANSPELGPESVECAEDILQAGRRLNRMLLSLLDVCQSEYGTLQPAPSLLDLRELVAEASTLSSARLRDKGLQLLVGLPSAPVELLADHDMLLRLITNLLECAARVAPSNSQIELRVSDSPDRIELRVSDAGANVAAADRAQLFDGHAGQTPWETTPRGRRGLGLSSCRILAEAHGGKIWLEDRPGANGITVCVGLPRQQIDRREQHG